MVMVRRRSEYGPLGLPDGAAGTAAGPGVPVGRRPRRGGGGGGGQRRPPGQELTPGAVREEPRTGRLTDVLIRKLIVDGNRNRS